MQIPEDLASTFLAISSQLTSQIAFHLNFVVPNPLK